MASLLTLSRLHIFAVYACKYLKKEKALGIIRMKRFFKSGDYDRSYGQIYKTILHLIPEC